MSITVCAFVRKSYIRNVLVEYCRGKSYVLEYKFWQLIKVTILIGQVGKY